MASDPVRNKRQQRERARWGLEVPPHAPGLELDEQTVWERAEQVRQRKIVAGLIRVFDDDPWRAQASCRGKADLFFGPDYERPDKRDHREAAALAICATCPVRAECRAAGRDGREMGVWGGETDVDRAEAGYADRLSTRKEVQRAARYARTHSEVNP